MFAYKLRRAFKNQISLSLLALLIFGLALYLFIMTVLVVLFITQANKGLVLLAIEAFLLDGFALCTRGAIIVMRRQNVADRFPDPASRRASHRDYLDCDPCLSEEEKLRILHALR